MAFQDSDPERRNLMVTSLAFIAYFFAGGEIHDGTIRLQVINTHFTKPGVLALIAWIALFWFLYRYWQKHSGAFNREFDVEFNSYFFKPYIAKFVSRKIGKLLVDDENEGYHLEGMKRSGMSIVIKFIYAKDIERNKTTNKIESYSTNKESERGEVQLDGLWGCVLRVRMIVGCCLKYPSFSSYIVPYILFTLAIIGAIYSKALIIW